MDSVAAMARMRQSPMALSAKAVALLTLMGCHPVVPEPQNFIMIETCSIYSPRPSSACIVIMRIHMCDYIVQNSPLELSQRAWLLKLITMGGGNLK